MTTTDLEQAYAKLREVKIKLSLLKIGFEADSDEDLSGDEVSELFNQAEENVNNIMKIITNKL